MQRNSLLKNLDLPLSASHLLVQWEMGEKVSVFAICLGQDSLTLQKVINIATCGKVHFEKLFKYVAVIYHSKYERKVWYSLEGKDFEKEEGKYIILVCVRVYVCTPSHKHVSLHQVTTHGHGPSFSDCRVCTRISMCMCLPLAVCALTYVCTFTSDKKISIIWNI